ncbi:MAG: nucleoside recognition domain-containing protein [Gemmataceae bacterium]
MSLLGPAAGTSPGRAFLTTGYPWWPLALVIFALYVLGLASRRWSPGPSRGRCFGGQTPVFVLEMLSFKRPSFRVVAWRVVESGWMFVRRAGTVILACMVLVWLLMYFPAGDYPARIAALDKDDPEAKRLLTEWKRQSLLGRDGRAIEPAVRPLGWDWRIGVAALASFPAREVVVGTLGVLFELGEVEADKAEEAGLGEALRAARWQDDPSRPLFTVPTALSLMVFVALCCQCASTLAVIRRETGTWRWPAFTFVYMTALAYLGALAVYQVGTFFGFSA